MKLIILGDVGSGKGTYGAMLSKRLKIPFISMGQELREEIADKTKLGMAAKKHVDAGLIVPAKTTLTVLKNRIGKPDCRKGYIVDGFPRVKKQAKLLDAFTTIDKVINLKLSAETIKRRLATRITCAECGEVYNTEAKPPKVKGKCDKCGGKVGRRKDEAKNRQRRKFMVGIRKVIKYYRKKGKVLDVNADVPFGDVEKKIIKPILQAIQ